MRFPKQLMKHGGTSLVRLQVDALRRHASRTVVVVGWCGGAVARQALAGAEVLQWPEWWSGHQADSVHRGLQILPEGRVLVQPVDVPPPSPRVLDALLAEPGSAVPTWQGRPGHPIVLGGSQVARLRLGAPEGGLRTLLAHAPRIPVQEPSVCWNLNRASDLVAWLRWQRDHGPSAVPSGS